MSDNRKAQITCQMAINLMQEQNVAPTPENYAFWFHYALNENQDLVDEVNKMRKQKVTFTSDINEYLTEKYTPKPEGMEQDVKEVTDMVSQVMDVMGKVQGDTENQNKKLGVQTEKLSAQSAEEISPESLSEIVGQLRDIQESNRVFAEQLQQSRSEAEQLRAKLQKAQKESQYDFLTGVYNRRALDEKMIESTKNAESTLQPLSLLMIDIDHFKKFNDTWGHQFGDMALKAVSNALTKSVRGNDIVARYGGEEFAILLLDTPPEGAKIVAEKIRKSIDISTLRRKDTGTNIEQITVSIGVSLYRHGEGDTVPFFIKRADEALYRAKTLGRNCVQFERS